MPDFESVKQLDLSGQTVVVGGGTQGIGLGFALLCARLGARVVILGRSGSVALSQLTAVSLPKGVNPAFVSGDLSTVAGTKEVAAEIKEWLGDKTIDLLFMCQGGPPSAFNPPTEDGVDSHFGIQVMSRFVLANALLQSGALKSDGTVVCVAGAGMGAPTIDPDNIDLAGSHAVFRMRNGATAIDCITKGLHVRYPSLRALHLYPGGIRTDIAKNSHVPWVLAIPFKLLTLIPGMTMSTDEYAPIALWTAVSEEARGQKDVWSWYVTGVETKPPKAAEDPVLCAKVWDRLASVAKM